MKQIGIRVLWIGTLLLLCQGSLSAQNPHIAGLALGYSYVQEQLPEGYPYQPFLIMGHYATYLSKSTRKGKLGIIVEPQFNPVRLGKGRSTIEFGLNAGLTYGHDLGRSHLYGGISSGPHYIAVRTAMQARGFIFSDNFFAGLRSQLGKKYRIDLQARFRHISNAGLQSPNLGIDNFLFVIALGRVIYPK